MANYILRKESKEILKQMGISKKEETLLCPILKVLQMRHSDLDMHQAKRVVLEVLHD